MGVAGTQELRRYAGYDQEEEAQEEGEEAPGLGELKERIERNLTALRLPELIGRVLQHFDLIEWLRHYYKKDPRGAVERAAELGERLGISIGFISGSGVYPELVVKPTSHFEENYVASLVLSEDRLVRFYRVGEDELELTLVEEGEDGEPVETPLGRHRIRAGT